MLKLKAVPFVSLIFLLGKLQVIFTTHGDTVMDEDHLVGPAKTNIDALISNLELLRLPVSVATAKRLRTNYRIGSKWSELKSIVSELENALTVELDALILLAINDAKYTELYQQGVPLFGEDVFKNFPSASDDIAEAAKCLALDRGTACVMHLNRVLEVGLRALASALGVPRQNNWGLYLQEIRAALDARVKAKIVSSDEIFYHESEAMLDAVRIAWRNPSMHIDKSYPVDKAEDIFSSVRTLMKHLATKLAEAP